MQFPFKLHGKDWYIQYFQKDNEIMVAPIRNGCFMCRVWSIKTIGLDGVE